MPIGGHRQCHAERLPRGLVLPWRRMACDVARSATGLDNSGCNPVRGRQQLPRGRKRANAVRRGGICAAPDGPGRLLFLLSRRPRVFYGDCLQPGPFYYVCWQRYKSAGPRLLVGGHSFDEYGVLLRPVRASVHRRLCRSGVLVRGSHAGRLLFAISVARRTRFRVQWVFGDRVVLFGGDRLQRCHPHERRDCFLLVGDSESIV